MVKTIDSTEAGRFPASESQIFRLDDDGTGKQRYFFVAAMQEYAQEHLPVIALKADPDRARKMLTSGAVNAERVLELTKKAKLAPILFCVGAGKDGGDLIVDGNHRYVAWTLVHHEHGGDMRVPAFRVDREHWSQYIVPNELVPKLGLFNPRNGKSEASA